MLPTKVNLKCNAGKPPPPPWSFQYPSDNGPGTFNSDIHISPTNLHYGTFVGFVFNNILPILMGTIVLLFFVISSSFVVYGVVRHVYTDHLLPRKAKMVRKLGKHPESKRRKKYRVRARRDVDVKKHGPTSLSLFLASAAEAADDEEELQYMTFVKTEDTDTPFYLDDLIPVTSDSGSGERESPSSNDLGFGLPLTKPSLPLIAGVDDILESPGVEESLDLPVESYTRLPDVPSTVVMPEDPPLQVEAEVPKVKIPPKTRQKKMPLKLPYTPARVAPEEGDGPSAPVAPEQQKEKYIPKRRVSLPPPEPNKLGQYVKDGRTEGLQSDVNKLIERREQIRKQWSTRSAEASKARFAMRGNLSKGGTSKTKGNDDTPQSNDI